LRHDSAAFAAFAFLLLFIFLPMRHARYATMMPLFFMTPPFRRAFAATLLLPRHAAMLLAMLPCAFARR